MVLTALARLLRRESGTSVLETALLLPLILTILYFAIFFWDVSKKRIKSLEVARFAAWEQTAYQNVLKSGSTIAAETRNRYQDLDGTTPTGAPAQGKVDFNKATLKVDVSSQNSVDDRGVPGMGGLAASAVGTTLKPVFSKLVGSNRLNTLSVANVTLKVENLIVPKKLGDTDVYSSVFPPFLEFKATNAVIYDSWDAWRPGDNPANSQAVVRQRIVAALDRSKGVVAFPVLGAVLGNGTLFGTAFDAVLGVLGLPQPFIIRDHYVQMGPRTLAASITGTGSTSAGIPGRLHEAYYWTGNGTLNSTKTVYRRLLDRKGTGLYGEGVSGRSNRHARAEECRGYYFEGSRTQQAEFYDYLIDNNRACAQSNQRPYSSTIAGTRRGLRAGGLRVEP